MLRQHLCLAEPCFAKLQTDKALFQCKATLQQPMRKAGRVALQVFSAVDTHADICVTTEAAVRRLRRQAALELASAHAQAQADIELSRTPALQGPTLSL
jgi:hypothetical protein